METVPTQQPDKITEAWVSVTPAKAMEWLEHVGHNRSVSMEWVKRLARMMVNGDWKEMAGDPIRFSRSGELIDGQHRLWAVVESKCTIRFKVIRALDDSVMPIIQYERVRTFVDFLKIKGEARAAVLAGAIGYLMTFDRTGVLMLNRDSMYRSTPFENLAWLGAHPEVRDFIPQGESVRKVLAGGGAKWTAVAYLLTQKDSEDAEAFLCLCKTGTNLTAGSPILALRTPLISALHASTPMPGMEYTALVIKAWNMYRKGLTSTHLTWRAGGAKPEPFPMIE